MKGLMAGTLLGTRHHDVNGSKLEVAKYLESTGKSRDEIWKETGFGRDAAGNWMWEQSDRNTLVAPKSEFKESQDLDDIIKGHGIVDELGGEFGFLDEKLTTKKEYPGTQGSYEAYDNLNIDLDQHKTHEELRETTLHELQHLADVYSSDYEGGTNRSKLPEGDINNWMYLHQMDETKARNNATRQYMSESERRDKPPWSTQDIPDARQSHGGKPVTKEDIEKMMRGNPSFSALQDMLNDQIPQTIRRKY